ncbi:uncharacterized protein LOC125940280 [Dermacentor silvarum]|uniref:uncharacterized protein LOC125940280 n=1 Tax=Dermacentor silvarum TaxID=543639 RepID=UPI0021019D20|nr:uncharacterized protein LOC125940280 [Dermacentor silvarum]
MGSGISPPPPFLVSPGTPAIPWPRWLRLFENFTLASGASELSAARRRALLLHCLGPEGQRIFDALPPPPPSNAPDHRPRIRVREPPPFRRLRLLQPPLQLERQRSNKPMPSSHSHRTSTTQLFKPWLDTFPLLATYASSDIASVTVVNCTVSRYRSLLLRFANWLRHATLPRKRIQICATSSSPGSHARAYGSGYCSRVTRSRLTAPWR